MQGVELPLSQAITSCQQNQYTYCLTRQTVMRILIDRAPGRNAAWLLARKHLHDEDGLELSSEYATADASNAIDCERDGENAN